MEGSGYVIDLKLTRSGVERLNALAAELFPKPPPENEVAIVLDGAILSAPAFQDTEYEAGVVISGNFTRDEAVSFARGIRSATSSSR